MSLKITTTLKTQDGFELQESYARVAVANQYKGSYLQAGIEIYRSEAGFEAGDNFVAFPDLQLGVQFPYEYTPNTVNILDLAHDAMIATLLEQGIVAEKML